MVKFIKYIICKAKTKRLLSKEFISLNLLVQASQENIKYNKLYFNMLSIKYVLSSK
jgi:hypothetical protein